MPACTKEEFRDMMVAHYQELWEKEQAKGEKGLVIGWANDYSPILDVTETVMEVDPTIEEARLTVWGDPAHVGPHAERLLILGPNEKRIVFDSYARVRHWMQGIEPENMECPKDGKLYLVIFPCKLEIKKPGQGGDHKWLIIGTILGLGAVGLMYMKPTETKKVFMTGTEAVKGASAKLKEKLKR